MGIVGLHTGQDMVVCNLHAADKNAVVDELCFRARQAGYIDDTFKQGLMKREEEYPTGLPTQVPIAMPHLHDGCKQNFCGIATLSSPVKFGCMGDPDTLLQVQHVFLFGITDPSLQTKVLRRFSMAFRDSGFLNSCLDCKEREELVALLKDNLADCLLFSD